MIEIDSRTEIGQIAKTDLGLHTEANLSLDKTSGQKCQRRKQEILGMPERIDLTEMEVGQAIGSSQKMLEEMMRVTLDQDQVQEQVQIERGLWVLEAENIITLQRNVQHDGSRQWLFITDEKHIE